MIETFLKIFPTLAALIAAIWALISFNRHQRFKRLQNLSGIWKEFFKSDELLLLFNLMNEIESDRDSITSLSSADSKLKLRYLALIEEVSLYVSKFEVDKEYAAYLFQWHFHFVYGSIKTTSGFWENIGGPAEMQASYWSMSRNLARKIRPAV